MQVDCENLLSIGLLMVVSTSCNKLVKLRTCSKYMAFLALYMFLKFKRYMSLCTKNICLCVIHVKKLTHIYP